MMRTRLIACVALAVLSAGGAEAACASFTATPVSETYDPLGQLGLVQINRPITVTAASRDANTASVDAEFVDQNSGVLRVGSGGPVYTLRKGPSDVVVPLGAPFNPAYSFHHEFKDVGHGATERVGNVILRIDPDQDIAAGVYRENLDIQYRCSGTGRTDMQSGVLPIIIDVPSTLVASLGGGSLNGTVDFGDFSTLSQSVMVTVQSTGPYAVKINSANGQAMKLATAPTGAANAQIPYTVTFAGAPVSTSDTHFARSGVGGRSLPLSFTAGSIAGKRAGVYHDIVTVTFTPLAAL